MATPTISTTLVGASLEERVRTRAYQLYEERGREDGHAEEDWLRAEAEILSTLTKAA